MLEERSLTPRQQGKFMTSRRYPLLAPALLALGVSACSDKDVKPWSSASPIVIEAECGTLGAGATSVTDATDSAISYVWGAVESVRDEYNWTGVDEALALAEEHGFPFRFHVLIWGDKQPAWIATLPPEEQLAEIRQWFEAVNERYGQRITFLEVVNEFDNQPPLAAGPTAENEGNYIEALGGAGESGFDWVLTAYSPRA